MKTIDIIDIDNSMIGKNVTCLICDAIICNDAKIQRYNERYYICQNVNSASPCSDKLGYLYSRTVGDGTYRSIMLNKVTQLKLIISNDEIVNNYNIY